MDADMMRYIPALAKIFYQGQFEDVKTEKTYTSPTHTDKN